MAQIFPGNPLRAVAGLPAAVWLVFATTLVNRAGTMVVPFMALYVTRYLGVRPALAALTSSVHPEHRKAAVAVNRLAINLGMSVGPAAGGFLATVSFPLLFIVDGVSGLVASLVLTALLAWRPPQPVAPLRGDDPPGDTRRGERVLRDPRAVVFLTGFFLVAVVFYQHEGAMPLFLVRDLHYRESFYGMSFALNTVLIIVAEVPLNLAMAEWSYRWTMVLGAVLYAIGFGSMAVLHNVPGLLAAAVVWTFGEMIAIPASSARRCSA